MIIVVSAGFQEMDFQPDGSRTVQERIVMSDGQVYGYVWQGTEDAQQVLSARVDTLTAQAAEQERIKGMVESTRFPLTKYEFRSLFTVSERMDIDAFNANYANNPELSDLQKSQIRTGLEDYDAALSIAVPFLDSVQAMIQLYAAVGIISTDRAAEIIASGQ